MFFPKNLSCVLVCQGLKPEKMKEDCLECFLEHLQRMKKFFPEYNTEINSIIKKFTDKVREEK